VDNFRGRTADFPTVDASTVSSPMSGLAAGGGFMSGIRVTPEQLASMSARVSSSSASIEGELRTLANSLAPLGSDWAGVAQERFQSLWAEWQKSAEGLHQALSGISQLLGQAGNSYAEAERQIAASFGAT
jgi:WXG100 family type VII secretion target